MTRGEEASEAVGGQPDLPKAGETWKHLWLWAHIVKAGPKRVTYRTETRAGWETASVPTDRFMAKFHNTGLSTSPGSQATS